MYSLNFLLFFIILFFAYYSKWAINKKLQNKILILASCFFYCLISLKMAIILFLQIIATKIVSKIVFKLENEKKSKQLTFFIILLNLSVLIYFKYLNFFMDSFIYFSKHIGYTISNFEINILLPLGISYFTFKLISYSIETYRGNIEPNESFFSFSLFILFFPTIVSGPIDRPKDFISQLNKIRNLNLLEINLGIKQVLWGIGQKIIIADNISIIVSSVWNSQHNHSWLTLLIVMFLYSFQMYTDFSGLSHIAIGLARILGIKVAKNFNYPFFTKNISEYWRNWHMSLTSWLTDYVFMPINIRLRNFHHKGVFVAILINMVLVGLWHGPNIKYLAFGVYHSLLFVPLVFRRKVIKPQKLSINSFGLPRIKDFLSMLLTFFFVSIGLVFFVSPTFNTSISFLRQILFNMAFNTNKDTLLSTINWIYWDVNHFVFLFLFLFLIIEWKAREKEFGILYFEKTNNKVKKTIYYLILLFIYIFANSEPQFIYAQF